MKEVLVNHQCGFRDVWNFDSYISDKIGDGLIISPINTEYKKIIALSEPIKSHSFFDPQFYLPKSKHRALNSYDFFPNNIANGYETQDYLEFAYESGNLCVEFQVNCGFKYIVIPTLSFEEIPNNYINQLNCLYTLPFLDAVRRKNIKTPVLLSIIIKDAQINNDENRDALLTYLTSFSEISGIYIIPDNKRSTKRLKSIDFMYNLMTFIDMLKLNDLEVHLGYTDVEGYILSLADVDSISIGSYENLRKFDITRFDVKESKKQMGPNARLYSSKLLQWIDHNYISSLQAEYEHFDDLFDVNKYHVLMFQPEYHWHFSKPELYKHFFMSFYNQVKALPNDFDKRYSKLLDSVQQAIKIFEEISRFALLDSNSNGDHLGAWGTVLMRFAKYKRGV